jgi:hypothetical protein
VRLFDPLKKFKKVVRQDSVFQEIKGVIGKLDNQIEENEETVEEINERKKELEQTAQTLSERTSKYKNMKGKMQDIIGEEDK